MLLAAIIFTAVYYKVTAGSAKLLDMAPDVVDDLYSGCRKAAMEKFITSGLLKQELNNSDGFQKAWSASTQCPRLIPGGIKEHTAALSAYFNGDTDFIKTLDNAVETMGANVSIYENHFHFKSLHFLLMDSMMLLKPKECKTVYILQEEQNIPQKGSTVRFGSFTPGNSNYNGLKSLEDFDDQVLLNITSCFFVNLGDNICSNDKDAVLLSPAEVFTVEEVNKRNVEDSEYTEIVLSHSELNSTHNCYIFSRSPVVVSTQWLVSVLVASLFFSLTV